MSRRRTERAVPSLAVIGCGAIAETFHLPAMARVEGVRNRAVLVDLDLRRADRLAEKFGIPRTTREYARVLDTVDGAVVAVPPAVHAEVATACVEAGVHVLCEKPLAETVEDAERMVTASANKGVRIGVNQTRRLHPTSRKVKELLDAGSLGRVERVEFELGEEFDWPAATDAYFGRSSGGRGVLQDIGAHVVDLVSWWLGGLPRIETYRDDSYGGSEAVADLTLRHEGCRVHVRLSWLSKLSNEFEVRGSEASVRGEVYEWDRVWVRRRDAASRAVQLRGPATQEEFADEMIRNFLEVCRGDAAPLVPAADVADSIAVIDRCYQQRERFELPWLELTKPSVVREEAP